MYSVCAAVNDVEVIKCPLDVKNGRFLPKTEEIISILSGPNAARIKLLFLTSPGNPTGTCIPNDLVRTILDHPTWRGLVILDEAYIDFTDKTSAVALFDEGYQNLVVMQTLSKGFGLAGIRMGISFQSPDLAQILANTKAPYSIGTPTASVALRALSKEVSVLSRAYTALV
jgi:histidinol-phosphate aminotransferase